MGLRHGPNSYGRQQWGILHNGGNSDAATPREGRRFSDRKPLSTGTKDVISDLIERVIVMIELSLKENYGGSAIIRIELS